MKKIICLLLFPAILATGLAQNINIRFKTFGTRIPPRHNLEIRWEAPTNALPTNIWMYRLLPRKLSPATIAYLRDACSFTDKDKTDHDDLLIFKSQDDRRRLQICFSLGTISYETRLQRSPTNLVQAVPNEQQAIKLLGKFLSAVDIPLADIKKATNNVPDFPVFETGVNYFDEKTKTSITNIESRGVRFGRTVDGINFLSANTGGDGEVQFGEHGRIARIDLSWRNLERSKLCPVISPEKMMQYIRQGKAVYGGVRMDGPGIPNWREVKRVTIKEVKPCYDAGSPLASSDWLYPFAALWTTVESQYDSVDVEIDCPLID